LAPPYIPVSATANFTDYAYNGFSYKEQEKLQKYTDDHIRHVMLTNSNTHLVRELYAPFARYMIEVGSKRAINCKSAKRKDHTDLIIRNYI
jgi:DNA adenine methylase